MSTLGILHRDIKLTNIFIGESISSSTSNMTQSIHRRERRLQRFLISTTLCSSSNGFVLVGDFGLATSALAEVDPSALALKNVMLEPDMTLGKWSF